LKTEKKIKKTAEKQQGGTNNAFRIFDI